MRITGKQEAFARAIAAGKAPSEAYLASYNWNGSAKVASIRAQEVLKHPLVAAKIAKLKAATETELTMSRQEKREMLAELIRRSLVRRAFLEPTLAEAKAVVLEQADALKALEIDNRMAGHNAAEKMDVNVGGRLLAKIRGAAKKP